jgi:hypothetical protein
MPLPNSIRIRRIAGIAFLAVLSLSNSAYAGVPKTTAATRATCIAPLIEQPFLSFKDKRDYVLAPGGSFEDPTMPGWTLQDGATITEGNEPFNVRRSADRHSLSLPPGASATTPKMCVDLNWPTMRFVAAQLGVKGDGELDVEVLYPEAGEKKASWHRSKTLKAKLNDGWHATEDVKMDPTRGGNFAGGRPVALRFTNSAEKGRWQIDNVYVDPHRR